MKMKNESIKLNDDINVSQFKTRQDQNQGTLKKQDLKTQDQYFF